jgi:hypothetical protein
MDKHTSKKNSKDFRSAGVRSYREISYRERTRDEDRDIQLALVSKSASGFIGAINDRPSSGRTRSQADNFLSNVPRRIVQQKSKIYFRIRDVAKIYFIPC